MGRLSSGSRTTARGSTRRFDAATATSALVFANLDPVAFNADEAAQVAFVKAWKALASFRGEAALRTWLTRIAINVARTMLAGRRPTDSLDDQQHLADPWAGSDEELQRDGARRRVRRAVAALPQLLELAGHHVGEGGVFIALKGRYPAEELRQIPAGWDYTIEELSVPGLDAGSRHVVLLRRA